MTATPPPTTLSPASSTDLPTYATDADADADADVDTDMTKSASTLRPLYLIVATALHPPLGIGLNGTLPWPSIRADMNFFQRVTRDSRPAPGRSNSGNQGGNQRQWVNAVVMGRKTWSSIPPRFRPLAGRVNVVVTRSSPVSLADAIAEEWRGRSTGVDVRVRKHGDGDGDGGRGGVVVVEEHDSSARRPEADAGTNALPVVVASSLSSAIETLDGATPQLLGQSAELSNVFVIGGAEIYGQSLQFAKEQGRTIRILQTLVKKSDGQAIACDTFFPVTLGEDGDRKIEDESLSEWLATDNETTVLSLPQGEKDWYHDEKSGFDVRVVAWERPTSR